MTVVPRCVYLPVTLCLRANTFLPAQHDTLNTMLALHGIKKIVSIGLHRYALILSVSDNR